MVCFFLLLFLPTTSAATYYVSPVGNDNNSGSRKEPWRTPQKAADEAVAGDTIYFKAGIYNITSSIIIKNSGRYDAWITFSAAPGEERRAIFTGQSSGGAKGAWFSSGNSYIHLKGLNIQNIKGGAGIWLRARESGQRKGTARGIHIDNCRIYNVANMGIAITGVPFNDDVTVGTPSDNAMSEIIIENCELEKTNEPNGKNECISVGEGVADIIVRNNWLHDSEQYGIDFKEGVERGVIYGNLIHNIEKVGIYIDAFSKWDRNIKIYNNIIHHVGAAGIAIDRENWAKKTPELNHIYVFNNLIYNTGRNGISLFKHKADNDTGIINDIRIINNTVYKAATNDNYAGFAIYVFRNDFNLSSCSVQNNITWNTDGGAYKLNAEVVRNNNIFDSEDPLFVDIESGDFHLLEGSPAIDTGIDVESGSPKFDCDYLPRPLGQGVDLGAYEYK